MENEIVERIYIYIYEKCYATVSPTISQYNRTSGGGKEDGRWGGETLNRVKSRRRETVGRRTYHTTMRTPPPPPHRTRTNKHARGGNGERKYRCSLFAVDTSGRH